MSVPDLAFSELDFLNSRPHATVGNGTSLAKESKRRGSKKADHNTELSRYFSRRHDFQDHSQPSRLPSHKEQQLTSDHLIELPQTPFLGFGSSGHKSSSPNKRTREPVTTHVFRTYDRGPRSPTKSTSYLSWSQTHPRTPSSDLRRQANNSNVHRSPAANHRSPMVFSRPPLRTSPKSPGTRNEGEVSERRDVHHGNQSSPAALSQGSRTAISREKIRSDFAGRHHPISNAEQSEVGKERGEKGDIRAQEERLLEDVGQAQNQPEQVAPQFSDGHIPMAKHRSEKMPTDNNGSKLSLATMPDSHRTGDYVDFLLEQCKAPLVNETVKPFKESHVQHSDPTRRRGQESPPPGVVQDTKTRPPARQSHTPPQHLNMNFKWSRADLSSSRGIEHRPPHSISTSSRLSSQQRSHPSHTMLESNMNPATPQASEADSRNAWNMYGHLYDRQREGRPTPWLNKGQLKSLGRNISMPETPRDQTQLYSGMYSTPGTNDVLENGNHGSNGRETEVIDDDFIAAAENPSKSLLSSGMNSLEEVDRAASNHMAADQSSFDDEVFAPPPLNDSAGSFPYSFVNNIHRLMASPAAVSFSPDIRTQQQGPLLHWTRLQRRKPSLASDSVGDELEGFWKPNKLY